MLLNAVEISYLIYFDAVGVLPLGVCARSAPHVWVNGLRQTPMIHHDRPPESAQKTRMNGHVRHAGLEVVGDVPWGTHFCQFYQTPQDLLDVLVGYFRQGLEDNEFCMWITSEPLGVEEARAALRRAVPDLDEREHRGQIELLDYRQWYAIGGQFDADRVLRGWVEKEQAALGHGYEGLRLSGNTFWLEKSDWKAFADYEAVVDSVIGSHRMLALCTYSLEKCGSFEVLDVVRNHQFALIQQEGKWELIQSQRHRRVEEALRTSEEDRKRAEGERETAIEFLRLINASASTRHLVEASVRFFHALSGCEAVGVRLQDGDDYPYCEAHGFPEEFVVAENSLCQRDGTGQIVRDTVGNPVIECMCGNVICGRFDPSKSFFTPVGSFWTNSTTQLLASTTDAERQARTRNRCNGQGYESVALIALRCGEQRLGLLQLNDRRRGLFTPEVIAFWERLAGYLAVTLAHARAHEAMQQAKEDWEQTFNTVPDCVAILDDQHRVVLANQAMAERLGVTTQQCVGLHCYEAVHGTTQPPEFCPHTQTCGDHREHTAEVHEPRLGGDFLVSTTPRLDEQGRFTGAVHVARDISERKRAEQAARESETQYRHLLEQHNAELEKQVAERTLEVKNERQRFLDVLETLPVIVVLLRPDYRVEWVNRAYRTALGDNVGRLCYASQFGRDEPCPECQAFLPLKTGQPHNWEWSLPNGRTFDIHNFPFADSDGSPLILEMDIDVTERRRAEAALQELNKNLERRVEERTDALRQSESRYRRLMQSIPIPLGVVNRNGEIIHFNDRFTQVFGYSPADIPTLDDWWRLAYPDPAYRRRVMENWQGKVQRSEETRTETEPEEFNVTCKDGTVRVVVISNLVIEDCILAAFIDITERNRAEEALRLTQASVDGAAEMVAWFTPDGRVYYANDATCRALGYSHDELLKMSALDFSPGFTWEQYEAHWQEVRQRKSFTLETIHRRKDGSEYPAEILVNYVVYGGQEFIFAYGRDITERKRTEERLRESREQNDFLAGLIRDSSQPLGVGYPDGRLGLVNRAFEELTGYSADELRLLDWATALTPPEWRQTERDRLAELHRTRQPVRYEKEYIRKDGTRVPIELLVHLVTDAEGKPRHYYSFITDITERKQAEMELERMRDLLAEGQQIAHLGSFEYVAATQSTIWSEEEYRIYGLDPTEPSPAYEVMLARHIHPDDAAVLHETFSAAVRNRAVYELEHRIMLPDGSVRHVYDRAHPHFDERGQLVRYVGATLDITERKRAEELIKASLHEKEVLLKEIHHRVKNNMQVISSLVALQAERSQDTSMRDVLQDVTDRVRSMALVHEKLYQSADMARVDFAEYVQSLLGYLWRAHGTAASGVRLRFDLEPVQLSVNAAVPCGLILNELATNALKHAFHGRSDGEVAISLRGTSEGGVCLRVCDNGTGLPPGLDWRHANSLGLRIVQILAGQLRATVEASSGEGTEFTVTFGKHKT